MPFVLLKIAFYIAGLLFIQRYRGARRPKRSADFKVVLRKYKYATTIGKPMRPFAVIPSHHIPAKIGVGTQGRNPQIRKKLFGRIVTGQNQLRRPAQTKRRPFIQPLKCRPYRVVTNSNNTTGKFFI